MLIKKAYQGEFKHLLSILRLAVLDNRSFISFPKKKFNYSTILQTLRKAGFIESYEERKEIIIIGLKQTYWKSFRHPMHAFFSVESVRMNKRSAASAKEVVKHQLRQGQVQHLTISTNLGIISGYEAAAKKVGGIPLFKIY